MKYFSIETVVNAYKGFLNCMTNKSWGYLALLKGCGNNIHPFIPYEVDLDVVSNFLENIFNLTQSKKTYNSAKSLYVVFSKKWDSYFNDQGENSPNIYDVIVWAYRRKQFAEDVTREDVIAMFADEFNIPLSVISKVFNTQVKSLAFSDSLYQEIELKSELYSIGVNVTTDNIDAKKGAVVAAPGEISRGPFIQTLYTGLDITDYVIIMQSDYKSLYIDGKKEIKINNDENKELPLQKIFYGAPGTGKSHKVKDNTKGEKVIRTTFHPDSDYSTFVGCYKPHMEEADMTTVIGETLKVVRDESGEPKKEKRIVYKYSCQAFLQAYIAAWQKPEEKQYLVIEEINRGNCAQIFGDLFQLLDRNRVGYSDYPINTDTDLAKELKTEFASTWELADNKAKEIDDLYREHYPDGITKKIKNGELLLLPKNLYIWATMNTSDQSLFPIDSAFKRRWDWVYTPIAQGKDKQGKPIKWQIEGQGEDSWWTFIQGINEVIDVTTHSEDKKLGFFFCKDQDGVIKKETFVNKVIFYLWNDVFKVYGFKSEIFDKKGKDGKTEKITFKSFYKDDGSVNEETVSVFVKNVMAKAPKENSNNDTPNESEEVTEESETEA